MSIEVLDLFSAAAGGWSLGMHRAGFKTIAACEFVDWRRALYQQNNPEVRIYDDVRTLTANQLLRDFGRLPSVVVGSPPCQDVSSANTKGKGVEGERSVLYFQAVRIVGEVRPRWFAFENSSNLRTRGADAVLAALEALGYACWTFVVRAGDIGANHERPRSWIIGCDVEQVTDSGKAEWWQVFDSEGYRDRKAAEWGESSNRHAEHVEARDEDASDPGIAVQQRRDAVGRGVGWPKGSAGDGIDGCNLWQDETADTDGIRRHERWSGRRSWLDVPVSEDPCRNSSDADQAGQADGRMVSSLRQAEISNDGCGSGRRDDRSVTGQMGLRPTDSSGPAEQRSGWSLDDLTSHLQLDDGLSAWLAGARIAVGGPRGTSAASLVVEAFGDAVVPQIPEAIGRAILRTEKAMATVCGFQHTSTTPNP